ncbi:MAG: HAMP domain-containing histidine kinase [Deltaproteobacteria bacterium]|nr:HAMP domain-containing histidine kinase [Deltaproteobacteria bacterium]
MMRLTIFWRLVVGYLIIFILVMIVGIYAIIQLKRFNTVTQYILNVDNRILEYEKNLVDLTLSQHRFMKKYIISGDRGLYNQFFSTKEAFSRNLDMVLAVSDTRFHREPLTKIKEYHDLYQSLVGKETGLIQAKRIYSKKEYESEKERLVDGILKELDLLEVRVRQDAHQRMKEQGEAGDSARTMAVILASLALGSIIVISFLITRSITAPLGLLRLKTREIAEGVFKSDLKISSSPEISELAQAFNLMIHRLSTLEKMKSDFFSTMSHELRTPLTSIKEGIALLQEGAAGPVTDKQKKLLDIVAQESRRLIELVNSSLDFSKMEAGMMTYHFEPADLVFLINKVILEMGPLVESKKIRLEAEVKASLPKVTMDQERILQVLRNLIGNALKFTPEGGRIGVFAGLTGQGIKVAVRDTGPGIPENSLLTIFNKFQQVIPEKSFQIKGSGLGLAIVKHIITSHGGRVWAESKLGQGSTFYFVLPV